MICRHSNKLGIDALTKHDSFRLFQIILSFLVKESGVLLELIFREGLAAYSVTSNFNNFIYISIYSNR